MDYKKLKMTKTMPLILLEIKFFYILGKFPCNFFLNFAVDGNLFFNLYYGIIVIF